MALTVDHISYIYDPDAPLPQKALDDISLSIPEGQFIGVIGHTGSGKSTLMQHLNGLVKATSGHIYFNGKDIDTRDYDKKELRSKVGLVFQYPEHQLFEVDVFSDVCFGPKNLGLDKEEVERRAREALARVGLPEELYQNRAGAFVSLKEDGRLRGCIGTIRAVRESLAEEIMHNAVSADIV